MPVQRVPADSKFSCQPRFRFTGRHTLSQFRTSCGGQYWFPAPVLPCSLCYGDPLALSLADQFALKLSKRAHDT